MQDSSKVRGASAYLLLALLTEIYSEKYYLESCIEQVYLRPVRLEMTNVNVEMLHQVIAPQTHTYALDHVVTSPAGD